MRIPSSFYLFGQKITVEWMDDLVERDDAVGQSRYRKNTISLQKNNAAVSRPDSQREKTFCHELVHWIFYMLHELDLDNNERLVDTMALLLHQAFETAEYAHD